MRLIAVFFLGVALVLYLFIRDLSQPAVEELETVRPAASQPVVRKQAPTTPQPLFTMPPVEPVRVSPPPSGPPAAALLKVAVSPPPLPAAEIPPPAPAEPIDDTPSLAETPTPRSSEVVWADSVQARLTQETLRGLQQEAVNLPADAAPETRRSLAEQLAAAGRVDAELAILADGIRADPDAIRPRVEYAAGLMRYRLWSQAAEQWREIVARDAGNPYAWHNLALALQESGQLSAALEAWDTTLQLSSDNVDGFAQRGVLHLQREDWAGALADFQAVLAQQPEALDALLNGALAALRAGDYGQARTWSWAALRGDAVAPEIEVAAIERLLEVAVLSRHRDLAAEQRAERILESGVGGANLRDLLAEARQ